MIAGSTCTGMIDMHSGCLFTDLLLVPHNIILPQTLAELEVGWFALVHVQA